MQKSLTIIGAGAWGSALAIILSDKFDEIFLIDRDKEIIKKLGKQHPVLSRPFTKNITLNHDISSVAKSEGILIATPSYAFSDILENIKSLQLSPSVLEELVQKHYVENKKIISLEGNLLRLAMDHNISRNEFIKFYIGNEINPNLKEFLDTNEIWKKFFQKK